MFAISDETVVSQALVYSLGPPFPSLEVSYCEILHSDDFRLFVPFPFVYLKFNILFLPIL